MRRLHYSDSMEFLDFEMPAAPPDLEEEVAAGAAGAIIPGSVLPVNLRGSVRVI